MSKCAIKRGFLILRECGAVSSKLCPECGRMACDDHVVLFDNGKKWICVDCHARQEDDEPQLEQAATSPAGSSAWRHRYRDHYYRGSQYTPFYAAGIYDHYYDDYDTRAFDPDMAEAPEMTAEEGGPDFMDS